MSRRRFNRVQLFLTNAEEYQCYIALMQNVYGVAFAEIYEQNDMSGAGLIGSTFCVWVHTNTNLAVESTGSAVYPA